MKKFVSLVLILSFNLFSLAQASVLKGTAIDEISTTEPKDTISIKISKNFSLNDEITLKKGYILTGKMQDITQPEQWHHNASFTFVPTSYTDLNGEKHLISQEIKGTYRQKMKPDYKHSEITAGSLMFSPAYIDDAKNIFQGKSKEVWDDYANRSTPWGKGIQIDIKPNEVIYFNFPN